MFTEINYEGMGSGCPFCGTPLNINPSKRVSLGKYNQEGYVYACICDKCSHAVFVKSYSSTSNSNLLPARTAYVNRDEWFSYLGIPLITAYEKILPSKEALPWVLS